MKLPQAQHQVSSWYDMAGTFVPKNNMAVSTKWGVLVVGVLILRALVFGVYIRAPVSWKLLYSIPSS